MLTSAGNAISQFGEFKKKQDWIMTSEAFGIGKGTRADPLQQMPHWTPSPNTYNISKGGNENDAPKYR